MPDLTAEKKYLHDTDFLSDELFIEWRLARTDELDAHWADFVCHNPACADALNEAVRKFAAVRLNERRLTTLQSEKLWRGIAHTCNARLSRRRTIMRRLVAAACVAVVAVVSVALIREYSARNVFTGVVGGPFVANDVYLSADNQAIQIGNNAEIAFAADGTISIIEDGIEQKVDFAIEQTDSSVPVIHKLVVPHGRRSTLTLSDGSRIVLNAGTELEFPLRFVGEKRVVHVSGEIFIDVVADGRPFEVHSSDMIVRVTGTSFNFSAYPNSSERSVVLVSGGVEVLYDGVLAVLSPSGRFQNGSVSRLGASELERYVSWVRGYMVLDNTPMHEILDAVGAYYGIEFRGRTESRLSGITCSGRLILSDDPEDVLRSVCLITGTEFERTADDEYRITIKK